MVTELRELQVAAGAVLAGDLPVSFGNDADAIAAAHAGVAVGDRSHWGLIKVSDADRLRFLHNQTTNWFEGRQPGEICDTVFVTSTARTIDLTTAYITADAVLLLTSPGLDSRLMDWMDRYIFFADKVKLENHTAETAKFSLVGPAAEALLTRLGLQPPTAGHIETALGDIGLRLAAGSGLSLPGYTLLVDSAEGGNLWRALTAAGAVALGEQPWQQLMAQQGRPLPGSELTEDYNPLEAGLWQTIAFDKGCYIGQETIARLNTYQGVKQQLWGLTLSGPVTPGTAITHQGTKVGTLTRAVETTAGWRGLGYIRTKAGGAGLQVVVGEAQGTVVDLPLLSRGYLANQASVG